MRLQFCLSGCTCSMSLCFSGIRFHVSCRSITPFRNQTTFHQRTFNVHDIVHKCGIRSRRMVSKFMCNNKVHCILPGKFGRYRNCFASGNIVSVDTLVRKTHVHSYIFDSVLSQCFPKMFRIPFHPLCIIGKNVTANRFHSAQLCSRFSRTILYKTVSFRIQSIHSLSDISAISIHQFVPGCIHIRFRNPQRLRDRRVFVNGFIESFDIFFGNTFFIRNCSSFLCFCNSFGGFCNIFRNRRILFGFCSLHIRCFGCRIVFCSRHICFRSWCSILHRGFFRHGHFTCSQIILEPFQIFKMLCRKCVEFIQSNFLCIRNFHPVRFRKVLLQLRKFRNPPPDVSAFHNRPGHCCHAAYTTHNQTDSSTAQTALCHFRNIKNPAFTNDIGSVRYPRHSVNDFGKRNIDYFFKTFSGTCNDIVCNSFENGFPGTAGRHKQSLEGFRI